jgi:hypothetical protein
VTKDQELLLALRERNEARAEVERLRALSEMLKGTLRDIEYDKDKVAERQREACAKQAGTWSTAAGDAVRVTPLVTEGDK